MKQKKPIFLRVAAGLLAAVCLSPCVFAHGVMDAAVESGVTVEQAGQDTEAGTLTDEAVQTSALPGMILRTGETYAFSGMEFAREGEVQGIFLTGIPAQVSLLLGSRVLHQGDAVSAADLSRLTLRAEKDQSGEAQLCFLPIRGGRAEDESVLTLHIASGKDEAPVAKNGSLETYRNLPNTGRLRAANDDDGGLTFALVTGPSRGSLELSPDGRFTYTPQKNKVGEDFFTFTAADEAGNISNVARVEIRILRPRDESTFSDLPVEDQFTPQWMRQTGLFDGERVTGRLSFGPEQTVTRGEFLCMALRLAEIQPDRELRSSGFSDEEDAPAWMRPYLAAAMRRGIVRGYPSRSGLQFLPNQPITAAEAAVMLCRAMELEGAVPASLREDPGIPAWARAATGAIYGLCRTGESGFCPELPDPASPLTRRQAADLLYAASGS